MQRKNVMIRTVTAIALVLMLAGCSDKKAESGSPAPAAEAASQPAAIAEAQVTPAPAGEPEAAPAADTTTAATPAPATAGVPGGRIFVTNEKGNSISVINATTNQVDATIDVG